MRRGSLGRARQPPRPHLTHYGAPASAALKATAVWGLVFLRSTFSRPPEFSGFERQPKATADQPKRLEGDRAFARRSSVGHSPPPGDGGGPVRFPTSEPREELSPSAVPEPGTWAMMLFGFGMIGWRVRRRRPAPFARRVTRVAN